MLAQLLTFSDKKKKNEPKVDEKGGKGEKINRKIQKYKNGYPLRESVIN